MTSDDLIGVWREAYAEAGRLDFAPVGFLDYHPRLVGDGPASGLIYLMVARPRTQEFARWGCLPPWYGPFFPTHKDKDTAIGGKPMRGMRALVRDYSRPGDLVCDPTAGSATTLLAAAIEGRRAVGAELDPATFALAQRRIAKGYTPDLFASAG
jgi:site-specific DNA-methyltransferase (adenine-specific)